MISPNTAPKKKTVRENTNTPISPRDVNFIFPFDLATGELPLAEKFLVLGQKADQSVKI